MATTGTIQSQENFFFAISGNFKQQSAVDVPLANADIDILLPLVEPTRPARERQRETVYDCDGVHIIKNYVNSELLRWTFAVQPSARLFAGFMALARGAASAFSGSAVDEVVALSASGTGTFKLAMTFEGRTGQTGAIAHNATPAQVKAALEAMERPIEAGDIASVTGTLGTSMPVTFGGKLAKSNLPAFTIDNTGMSGGTAAQSPTAQGSNKVSTITRSTSGSLPLTSFVIGNKGQTASYKKYYNQAINSVTLTINKGQISSIQIEMVGSTRFTLEPTFTVPACVNYDPVRAKDVRVKVDGQWISGDTRSLTYTLNNQMPTDLDAYPFDAIYMQKFRRGLRQVETLSWASDGSEVDDQYVWALGEIEKPVEVYFGSPVSRAVLYAPVTQLSLGSPDIAYTPNGDTFMNINGEPHKDATLQTYTKLEYQSNESVPFLGV